MAEEAGQPGANSAPQDGNADAMLAAARAAISQLNDLSSEVNEAASAEAPDPDAAMAAQKAAAMAGGAASVVNTKPVSLPDFSGSLSPTQVHALELLSDVHLNVKIELGRTRMLVEDVLRLSEGAVVELDKLAGDPVDVYVNDRHVARGEVLVLNDNFCVRVNEILAPIVEGAGKGVA